MDIGHVLIVIFKHVLAVWNTVCLVMHITVLYIRI
jgi:hypothetical protein